MLEFVEASSWVKSFERDSFRPFLRLKGLKKLLTCDILQNLSLTEILLAERKFTTKFQL